jgi:hypothetical protein
MNLIIRIPYTYIDDTLNIKCLQLSGTGWPAEEAYKTIIKQCKEFYSVLSKGKLKQEGKYEFIDLPYNEKLYSRILELEPLPLEAKVKKNSKKIKSASSEEIINYGYPDEK